MGRPVPPAGRTPTPAKAGTSSAPRAGARPGPGRPARSRGRRGPGTPAAGRAAARPSRRSCGPQASTTRGALELEAGGAHGGLRAARQLHGLGQVGGVALQRRARPVEVGRHRRRAAAPAPRRRSRRACACGPARAPQLAEGALEGLLPVQQTGGVAAHGAADAGARDGVAPDQRVAHHAGRRPRARAVDVGGPGGCRVVEAGGPCVLSRRASSRARRASAAWSARVSTASWVAPSPMST